MRRAGLAVIGACVLFAACGGGSEGSDGSDSAADTSAAETSAESTAVVETTTTTSTSTTTSSTTTTSTLAPTTTLSPEQVSIAAAEAALIKAFEAKSAALTDPGSLAARDELARFWTKSAVPSITTQLDDFVADGMLLRISTDPVAFVMVVGESTIIGPERIDVTFCRLDSNIIVMAESIGGVEVVVDDIVTTRIWRGAMIFEDGLWRLAGAEITAEVDGEVGCDELL